MNNTAPKDNMLWVIGGAVIILAAAGFVGAWLGYQRMVALSERIALLEAEVATTTSRLAKGLEDTHSTLSSALEEEQRKASELESQLGSVQNQFGDITDTVDALHKLSTLDAELLKKYSKVYFLNENYLPAQLSTIPKEYTYNEEREYSILSPVLSPLTRMLRAAKRDGVEIFVHSAYRSFGEQGALKGQYSVVYGGGTANQFSADQGFSEHQLGTAVDLITTGLNGQLEGFGNTPAFEWLNKNAYRYGFVISYPAKNSYYIFEPWHWRFVGENLADHLHDENMYFYEMDQRELDSYLPSIFD